MWDVRARVAWVPVKGGMDVYTWAMPSVTIEVPAPIHEALATRHLSIEVVLEGLLGRELRRLELIEDAERYVDTLIAEVGEPSPEAHARAEAFAGRNESHFERVGD